MFLLLLFFTLANGAVALETDSLFNAFAAGVCLASTVSQAFEWR